MRSIPQVPSVVQLPTLRRQGSLLQLHCPSGSDGAPNGGKRGEILPYMSAASRRTFQRKMAMVDWSAIVGEKRCWFVTLTLSPHYWNDPDMVKAGLKRFRERMKYHWADRGYFGAFVRREVGDGGNVHFHLLVIGPDVLWDTFTRWISENWSDCQRYDTLDNRSSRFLQVDVDDDVVSVDSIRKYIGKYMSKAAYDGRSSSQGWEAAKTANGEGGESTNRPPANHQTGVTGSESLTKVHTSRKVSSWGRHWSIWEENSIPWAEVEMVETGESGGPCDSGPCQSARAVGFRVRRSFRKWLSREIELSEIRKVSRSGIVQAFLQSSGVSAAGYGRMCRVRQLRALRRAAGRAPEGSAESFKLPYYETLRRAGRRGYTILGSEQLLDSLIFAATVGGAVGSSSFLEFSQAADAMGPWADAA